MKPQLIAGTLIGAALMLGILKLPIITSAFNVKSQAHPLCKIAIQNEVWRKDIDGFDTPNLILTYGKQVKYTQNL